MHVYWIECIGGHFHLACKCPKCGQGVVWITSTTQSAGVISAVCLDCGNSQGLYVLPSEHKAWALAEPVKVTVKEG